METIKQAKIIKENGKQKIEFAKDSFGPYESVFSRTDCYYNDKIGDRGSVLFPYKNKDFNNTEIFLEIDDIVICTGDRTNLSGEEKTFIDIINLKTEKKQRLYVEEVNLIYNGENEIVVNANFYGVWKTIKLDNETMEIKEEKEEKVVAFLKLVFDEYEHKWYVLDWTGHYYSIKEKGNIFDAPIIFTRKSFKVDNIDIWLNSHNYGDINYLNNQNYLIDKVLSEKFLFRMYNVIFNKLVLISLLLLSPFYLIVFSSFIYSSSEEGVIPTFLIIFIIFYFGITITYGNLQKYKNDLLYSKVYRKKISNYLKTEDFEIIRNKPDISSKNQKIMIK